MNRDLLTEILDSVTAVHAFISADLSRENLSADCNLKRDRFSKILDQLCNKIRSIPPNMRPRMNTPNSPKPPPPIPPSDPLEIFPEDEEEYTNVQPIEPEAEDYLAFEPSQTSNDLSQEVYEAMEAEHPDPDDVYEEPRSSTNFHEETASLYEEPSSNSQSDGRPSTSSSLHPPTPSQSRENSASGAEYIEANKRAAVKADVSTDWTMIYSPPPKKGTGDSKVASLKGIAIKGYLEKLGGHSKKNWQKRYCVMSGPLMYFYEKESSKSYNNFVCVLNFTVSEEPSMTNQKKKQFAFKLTHTDTSTGKKKDYCFRANNSDTRNKWMTSIEKVTARPNASPPLFSGNKLAVQGVSATMPRMPSNNSATSIDIPVKPRSHTIADETEDLYEDLPDPIKEESENEEDYLPVSPVHDQPVEELTSSAEYVDVQPAQNDIEEEEYEDTTAYQAEALPPPPPETPPPGPPTVHSTPAVPPRASPAHQRKPPPPTPTQDEVDTSKLYPQGTNGIILNQVYVMVWDFVAHEGDEMGLTRGDLVLVNEPKESSDWWYGELLDPSATIKVGKKGLFPRQYTDLAFELMDS